MKKSASKVLSALLVMALMLSLSGMAFAETKMYAIGDVSVYAGPGTSYYYLGPVSAGDDVEWTGEVNNGWYRIRWSSYTDGWVSGNYLSYYDTGDYYTYTPSSSTTYNYSYYCQPTYTRNTVTLKVCTDCGDTYESTTALNVRSGPSTKYSIVSSLSRGEKCTVIGQSGNWYKLLTTTGADAYASASYLRLYATSKQPNKPGTPSTPSTPSYPSGNYGTYYAKTGLNVRQGPSTSYSIVYTLNRGEAVTFTGSIYGKWMSVKTRTGVQGYCSSIYLTQDSSSSSYNPGSTSGSTTTKYYCSNCGHSVTYGNTYCSYCGSRLSYSGSCTPSSSSVVSGGYYQPNYRTPLYASASSSASVLGYLDCYDTVVVQSANSTWAYVKVNGYNVYGYVPVDAIK